MRALDLQAPLREQEHGGNHVRDLFDIPDELQVFGERRHAARPRCACRYPTEKPVSQRAEDSTNSAIPAAIEAFSEFIFPFCSMRAT